MAVTGLRSSRMITRGNYPFCAACYLSMGLTSLMVMLLPMNLLQLQKKKEPTKFSGEVTAHLTIMFTTPHR